MTLDDPGGHDVLTLILTLSGVRWVTLASNCIHTMRREIERENKPQLLRLGFR